MPHLWGEQIGKRDQTFRKVRAKRFRQDKQESSIVLEAFIDSGVDIPYSGSDSRCLSKAYHRHTR
jgi:hypothetical protein